jgi:hypothetical protein
VIPDFAALFAFCDLHASRWSSRRQADMNALVIRTDPLGDLGPRWYDRQGFPIPSDGTDPPVIVWARRREAMPIEEMRVAYDELPDGSHLSTVWLGLDHGFIGRPQIFETMRFAGETHTVTMLGGSEFEGRNSLEFPDPFGEPGETTDQLRYTTEEEALAAHHEIVRRIRLREGH